MRQVRGSKSKLKKYEVYIQESRRLRRKCTNCDRPGHLPSTGLWRGELRARGRREQGRRRSSSRRERGSRSSEGKANLRLATEPRNIGIFGSIDRFSSRGRRSGLPLVSDLVVHAGSRSLLIVQDSLQTHPHALKTYRELPGRETHFTARYLLQPTYHLDAPRGS